MQAAFQALYDAAQAGDCPWLICEPNAPTDGDNIVQALQIRFQHLGLRRPSTLYRCNRTGEVWPRSVAGFFPGAKSASLVEMSHEDIDSDARLGRRRRELREWAGFKLGLWAEEHSAQLSPEENGRLQNLFREGMRNILSSTTTLELGIDIGGLSAVLLGNLVGGGALREAAGVMPKMSATVRHEIRFSQSRPDVAALRLFARPKAEGLPVGRKRRKP